VAVRIQSETKNEAELTRIKTWRELRELSLIEFALIGEIRVNCFSDSCLFVCLRG
jgi:hypothetical protein